jgi:hypothetical protein
MVTHIARAGKVIGEYSQRELPYALKVGLITIEDFWWRVGMKEWKSVAMESPITNAHSDTSAHTGGGLPPSKQDNYITPQAPARSIHTGGKKTGVLGYNTPSGLHRDQMNIFLQEKNEAYSKESAKEYQKLADIEMEQRAAWWLRVLSKAKEEVTTKPYLKFDSPMGCKVAHINESAVFLVWELHDSACMLELETLICHAKSVKGTPSIKDAIRTLKKLDARSQTWDCDQPSLFFEALSAS